MAWGEEKEGVMVEEEALVGVDIDYALFRA